MYLTLSTFVTFHTFTFPLVALELFTFYLDICSMCTLSLYTFVTFHTFIQMLQQLYVALRHLSLSPPRSISPWFNLLSIQFQRQSWTQMLTLHCHRPNPRSIYPLWQVLLAGITHSTLFSTFTSVKVLKLNVNWRHFTTNTLRKAMPPPNWTFTHVPCMLPANTIWTVLNARRYFIFKWNFGSKIFASVK